MTIFKLFTFRQPPQVSWRASDSEPAGYAIGCAVCPALGEWVDVDTLSVDEAIADEQARQTAWAWAESHYAQTQHHEFRAYSCSSFRLLLVQRSH